MTTNDSCESAGMASYSPTARDALGIRSSYLHEEDVWLHTLTYNRLAARWNMPDAQANVFLLSGAGMATHSDESKPAGFVGLEADWENRRLYVLYENRLLLSDAIKESFSQKFRVGVAPYKGGYDDVHTWLMVQVDHRPESAHEVSVTPFVRLFNNELLGEAGISNHGDILFNLTYQM